MAPSRQVVYDSDDSDDLSPLASPLAGPLASSPHISPSLIPPPPLPLPANPADASTSTDPSFFRDVYEEQQRALMADSGAHTTSRPKSNATIDRDPWEVPSSPDEPADWQHRGAKRKREAETARDRVSVVVQLDDVGSAPAKKQRRTPAAKADDERREQGADGPREADGSFSSLPGIASAGGLEISIPLEPMTPSRMYQYPRLLSSSIDQGSPNHPSAGQAEQTNAIPLDPHPSEAATESTVAYTTPSLYASSGRRAQGSSANNSSNKNKTSSHEGELQNGTAAMDATPPARRGRKATSFSQLLSSPDIIAEPAAPLRGQQRHYSPLEEEEEEDNDVWAPHSTITRKNRDGPTRRRQRQSSVPDELSAGVGDAVQYGAQESDASFGSPRRKPAPRVTKKKSQQRVLLNVEEEEEAAEDDEAVFIAASDDDDSAMLSPAESDFSVKAAKSKAKGKGKRGRPKKESAAVAAESTVVSVELPDQPKPKTKRPRGRPRQQKKPQQPQEEEEEAEREAHDDDSIRDDAALKAKAETPEPSTEAEPDDAKGKRKGRKGGGKSKDTKTVNNTALSETSGNSAAVGSFSGEEVEQENGAVTSSAEDQKAATKAEPPMPSSKPVVAGTNTGLGMGLGSSQGRVPYRVGLSKKFRIAPLLKTMRK